MSMIFLHTPKQLIISEKGRFSGLFYCVRRNPSTAEGLVEHIRQTKETKMKLTNTLLMTAAVAVLSTAAFAAEGAKNTDGTHNANNTQTDTNMGSSNQNSSNDAAADINANASTEAEMSDTSNDVDTNSDVDVSNTTGATVGVGGVNATVGATTSADATAPSMDRSTIKSVQSSLKAQGHSVSVDGKWGPRSAAALRDFQAANNLSATGELDTATMAALNIR
jgi:Putative peptidoglycan binding domain